jgi:NADH-quinone oxidoreductase subunit H
MGIALIALLMVTGSLSLKTMVGFQMDGYWNIVKQPLGFLIFLICVFAECNRTPFDLPEAENELIGGYHTEYSSMKLGLFLFAEYINMFISSAIMAGVYFGGYNMPEWFENLYRGSVSMDLFAIIGMVCYFLKIFIF